MAGIHFKPPANTELKPRIVVFGVGGAGGNAVNNMIEAGLEGVEFVVANTDAQQLAISKTERRIQLGVQTTQGLGAGAHPEVGMSAAEESAGDIGEHLDGAHMVFITAGMGGGTGTGAAPIIAKEARQRGILTVGVVTRPFHFEGRHRMRLADAGIGELTRYVDTLIVIPNQNLFRIANERTTFTEAFAMADQVLHSGVRSITDLMVLPGLINLDFADVRTVMTEMGKAMMGTGEAEGEDRALMAAQNAIQNPLLDEVSLKGAKAVLVNVTGGPDMTLLEVDEAANAISAEVDPEANIIFGAAFDDSLSGKIRVSVVATGMDSGAAAVVEPRPARTTAASAPAPAAGPARPSTPPPMVRPAAAQPPLRPAQPSPRGAPPAAPVAPAAAQAATPSPVWPEAKRPEAEAPAAAPAPVAAAEAAPATEAPKAEAAPAPLKAPEMEPAISRIVDPLVSEDDAPLFPEQQHERRAPKGGLLSIFGRPRQDPQPIGVVAPRAAAAPQQRPAPAKPTEQAQAKPAEDELPDASDELEIPSFLRRLAN